MYTKKPHKSRGWENVSGWYAGHVEEETSLVTSLAHPAALRLLSPRPEGRYLDIACGEGSFARLLSEKAHAAVVGYDASPSLVAEAKRRSSGKTEFFVADATRSNSKLSPASFDGATCILAIQNIKDMEAVFREASRVLKPGASLVLLVNHPCFRIPRQTSWGWDEQKKWMYRRVDKYLSEMEIPIQMRPGERRGPVTVSFHRPLMSYMQALARAGFVLDAMEELISPKTSKPGGRSRAENASRQEFPLFLVLRARLRSDKRA